MKKAIAGALATATIITACGQSDEWDSDFQRDQAFRKFYCQKLEDESSGIAGSLIAMAPSLYSDPGDRAVLIKNAQMMSKGVINPSCDLGSPDYDPIIVGAWEKLAEQRYGEEFTPSMAREAGIDIENP